jgi:hypothetical protein
MPIYYGNTELGSEYYGGLSQGRIYQGSNLVQNGDNSNLIAFYNIATPSCYTSGSDTVYDLSGNGNNLTITGSVLYSAASQSLVITGSTYANYGQLYSANQLTDSLGNNLLGTSSVFTIITFMKGISWGNDAYGPHWSFGTTAPATFKNLAPVQDTSFFPSKIGFGSQTGNSGEVYRVYTSANPATNWSWYSDTVGLPNVWGWNLSAFEKTAVNGTTNNMTIYTRGVNGVSGSLFSATTLNSGFPGIYGGSSQTTFNTDLEQQYLYIGKNPLISNTAKFYHFGGMAIFNRVLSGTEVNNYWDLFNIGR